VCVCTEHCETKIGFLVSEIEYTLYNRAMFVFFIAVNGEKFVASCAGVLHCAFYENIPCSLSVMHVFFLVQICVLG